MRFCSEPAGLNPLAPRVLSITLALTGLLYGLDGLLLGPSGGRAQAADRGFVVLIALGSAHLVWTLARVRRRRGRQAEESARELEREREREREREPREVTS